MSATNVKAKLTTPTTTTAIDALLKIKISSTEPSDADTSQNDDNTCVVCFKNVSIYSIGDCDHPVCYECSTRMRVLCKQMECPICRHVISKVLFTSEKMPYRELEVKNRSEYYSRKYHIGFCTMDIQQKFFELLDHPCPKCRSRPYRSFEGLKAHVRKEHNLYYCDLCVENLNIFTFERRCYTQSELKLHLTKGDPDNRSHRGHPLCEYCNERYLDRDELFRHLRRDHYFCHFCDADGYNEFYKDYNALAEHFRRDHFLCEEGKCATEQFVGAFRTEIDYKAHVANVHGKTMNKQQAKQTRTLQLEITLGPRGRSGQTEQGIANLRSRNEGVHDEYLEDTGFTGAQRQQHVTIDAHNEEEFPSLGGVAAGVNVSLVRPPPPSMRRNVVAALARTNENFPALGNQHQPVAAGAASPVIRKQASGATGTIARSSATAPANGMMIHVSNRPTSSQTTASGKKSNTTDFPALTSGKGKKNMRSVNEDMPPFGTDALMTNVAAKHRTLANDYVSVANLSNFQKLQMIQKDDLEAKARKAAEEKSAPKLTSADFPSLSGSGTAAKNGKPIPNNRAASAASDKKQREQENRNSKVAQPPILPLKGNANNNNNKSNKATSNNKSTNNNSDQNAPNKKDKKQKDKEQKKSGDVQQQCNQTAKVNSTKSKEKNNNNPEQKSQNANASKQSSSMTLINGYSTNNAQQQVCTPPPGFQGTSVKPPPGFISNVTINSVAKLPNNLTFTSSSGESYSIVPAAQSYTQPPDALCRNQKLVDFFRDALNSPEAFEEFRLISQKFREGVYKSQAYYDHCRAALQDKFDKIFPELLVLLPDISKQQELYLIHKQYINSLAPSQRKFLPKLEVCNRCKQVLLENDLDNHNKLHEIKNNFPSLGSTTKK